MTAMAVSIDRIAAPAARGDGLPRPRVAFGHAWPRRSLPGPVDSTLRSAVTEERSVDRSQAATVDGPTSGVLALELLVDSQEVHLEGDEMAALA